MAMLSSIVTNSMTCAFINVSKALGIGQISRMNFIIRYSFVAGFFYCRPMHSLRFELYILYFEASIVMYSMA